MKRIKSNRSNRNQKVNYIFIDSKNPPALNLKIDDAKKEIFVPRDEAEKCFNDGATMFLLHSIADQHPNYAVYIECDDGIARVA